MLDINEFAARYQISSSRARQLVRAGDVRAEKTNGRYLIAPEEAERWMTENPYRMWVRNISRPEFPPVAVNTCDFLTLHFCSAGDNFSDFDIPRCESHGNMWWRVQRLRKRGITVERVWRRGIYPRYRLKDIVEYEISGELCRLGPHRDYQGLQQE